jgi:hypothetical protein
MAINWPVYSLLAHQLKTKKETALTVSFQYYNQRNPSNLLIRDLQTTQR